MTALTEANHTGAYVGSVVDPQLSYETATVLSGQKLVAGQIIEINGSGKIIACDPLFDSDDVLINADIGILHAAVDASATGYNADVKGAVYLARMATVKLDKLTYPASGSDGAETNAVNAALKALFIRPR